MKETNQYGQRRLIVKSDLLYNFVTSPVTVIAAFLTFVIVCSAVFAPFLTPHDPFNPGTLELRDAYKPPVWIEGGVNEFPLGTDDQGHDVLASMMYGSRISLFVGFFAVFIAMFIGVSLGTLSGYIGGKLDMVLMRLADAQITIPALLIALLLNGVLRTILPLDTRSNLSVPILVLSIAFATWPEYARLCRGVTMVERHKEYVAAAKVIGIHPVKIMVKHIIPNAMRPVFVIATIGIARAIIIEASLSFLGVGMPPTTPSLGTLIRIGNSYIFSGEWWMLFMPAIVLIILVLSINLLGDWVRYELNPKLRGR
ncbi:ABC transporter permease [Marispirochaeta aestuarii]|uniref:ABC transporter permease n=1 Tax=Marispirochaeta aestuarii TaxID=1963862 RepID=UPI0029C8F9F9|nr:ABC transporter permease [Marispirochaeta aestuarii]